MRRKGGFTYGEMDWHERPVMYCFHRMPCTLIGLDHAPPLRRIVKVTGIGEIAREGRKGEGGGDGKAV